MFGHCPSVEFPYDTIETKNFGSCAKIQFALAPAARAACSKLGNRKWRRHKIQAYTLDRWKKILQQRGLQANTVVEEVIVKNKLFVGGLLPQFSIHTIRSYFTQFGPLQKTKLVTDRGGHSKGYGFVEFIHEQHAQAALQEKFHWIQGKQINIGPVKEKVAFRQQIQLDNLTPIADNKNKIENKEEKKLEIHKQLNHKNSPLKNLKKSSGSKTSSRSQTPTLHASKTIIKEEKKESKEEIKAYQNVVDKQLSKIQDEERNAKTLSQRRAERRARWKKKTFTEEK